MSVDSFAAIECPFSGVTKSGRVWRKMPESDARSVGHEGPPPGQYRVLFFFFFLHGVRWSTLPINLN